MTDPHYANIVARWKELAFLAQHIVPTKLPLEPSPGEIKAIRDDLEALIRYVDPLILAYGEMLVANGMSKQHLDYFTNRLEADLQGNATYCIDEMADVLQEEIMENVA